MSASRYIELVAKLVSLGLGLDGADEQAIPDAFLTQIDLADGR